jgi:putative ABC transport system substrate-binding protein
MQRREFITLLGGAATWSLAARAQQPERMRRVGIFMPFPPSNTEAQTRVRVFREALQNYGWTAGGNVQFDERWTADNMDLIRATAANLVELKTDVIVAVGARVIPILIQMTRSIPIIIAGGGDPVERGWVKNLALPGGNVTGFSNYENSIIGKMLQTLKEIAPSISRIAMIYNPDNPSAALDARSFDTASGALTFQPIIAPVHGLADIERTIKTLAEKPNSGIFFPLDLTVNALAEKITDIVARHRLPAIYSDRAFMKYGGLVFYGADRVDIYRRAASYVDRVLRGEKPGDLPYQQPTKFELVINLKTAKAIGVTVPPALLTSADEVIE